MDENKLSSISKADSDKKVGEFWDNHDFTEFDSDAPDAEFEIISTVPVQLELSHPKRQLFVRVLATPFLFGTFIGEPVAFTNFDPYNEATCLAFQACISASS